jgi:hypothetical protein
MAEKTPRQMLLAPPLPDDDQQLGSARSYVWHLALLSEHLRKIKKTPSRLWRYNLLKEADGSKALPTEAR